MKILVAYTKSKSVSVIRPYEYVDNNLLDNVIDLASESGFTCSHVLVVEDRQVVYEFIRGESPTVSKRADIEFKPLRPVTKKDLFLIKRAWEKSLMNLKSEEFLL